MNPPVTSARSAAETPLPLREGERLTRVEFERRYQAMPEVKKAELIEGKVYMASPVRLDQHARQQAQLVGWLFLYHAATPGVDIGDNASWRVDETNQPQPDGLLRIEASAGGGSHIDEQGYIQGTIELAAEVAASSASYDLGPKLQLYQRRRVQEYIVWRVCDGAIDWFTLQQNAYVRKEPGRDAILKSDVLPGLWLDAAALVGGDMPKVIAVLQQGLASQEHGEFVSRLSARQTTSGAE
jgi:hypothetical protein